MKLHIKNFKCFEDIEIPIKRLTTLVGANGMGKSSVIQSLLLLRQSIESKNGHSNHIPLNGPWGLNLGSSSEIINLNLDSGNINIDLIDNKQEKLTAKYSIDPDDNQLWINCEELMAGTILNKEQFYYLNAERIGPRISQNLQNLDYLQVGIHGEYTAQIINTDNGRVKVLPERKREGFNDLNLPSQVNAWLDFILPGVSIRANTDINSMTAQIKVENQYTYGHPVLSTNIGFGISYALPIITTGLIAAKDSFFIVENPESHIHPAAQSAMGKFLAFLADKGIWVVVETHSDHIINGMQIYVAKHKDMQDISVIDNFSVDGNHEQPIVDPIYFSSSGELSQWPKGFMDQAQIDYINLTKARTNV